MLAYCSRDMRAKGLRKNNLPFWHLIFTPSSAAPQSRNTQGRPGYACGFAQSFAAKSERQFYQVILGQTLRAAASVTIDLV